MKARFEVNLSAAARLPALVCYVRRRRVPFTTGTALQVIVGQPYMYWRNRSPVQGVWHCGGVMI
jgi:hypothetical protein